MPNRFVRNAAVRRPQRRTKVRRSSHASRDGSSPAAQGPQSKMVRLKGLEPSRRFQRYHLKVVRLPIPPQPPARYLDPANRQYRERRSEPQSRRSRRNRAFQRTQAADWSGADSATYAVVNGAKRGQRTKAEIVPHLQTSGGRGSPRLGDRRCSDLNTEDVCKRFPRWSRLSTGCRLGYQRWPRRLYFCPRRDAPPRRCDTRQPVPGAGLAS